MDSKSIYPYTVRKSLNEGICMETQKVGEVLEGNFPQSDLSLVGAKTIDDHPNKKNTIADYLFAFSSVGTSAALNVAGGYLAGSAISGGSIYAGIGGAILGLSFEVGVVQAHYRGHSILRSGLVHIICAASLIVGVQHVMLDSVSETKSQADEYQIALSEIKENTEKLDAYRQVEKSISELELSILKLKNKKVRAGILWNDSQHCTNDKHPNDCGKYATLSYNLSIMKAKISGVKPDKYVNKITELRSKYPESRLNQADDADKGIDKNVITALRDSIAPSMGLSYWIILISSVLAVGLQLVVSNALFPFRPARNGKKAGSSRIKRESGIESKRDQGFFKLFSLPARLAEKAAVAAAEKSAELKHSEEKRKAEKTARAEKAVLDIEGYLKSLSADQVGKFLLKKGSLDSFGVEKKKQITRAVFWSLNECSSGQSIDLRGMESAINERGMDAASYVNYKFVQSQLMKALLTAGLIENKGTEKRASYVWAAESVMRQSVKDAGDF